VYVSARLDGRYRSESRRFFNNFVVFFGGSDSGNGDGERVGVDDVAGSRDVQNSCPGVKCCCQLIVDGPVLSEAGWRSMFGMDDEGERKEQAPRWRDRRRPDRASSKAIAPK
jgi:hypothetical protein